jgi:hypothetical protein
MAKNSQNKQTSDSDKTKENIETKIKNDHFDKTNSIIFNQALK